MTSGPGDWPARGLRRNALPQPPQGDAEDRTPGAVDGPDDDATLGCRQAMRASELANGMFRRRSAQT